MKIYRMVLARYEDYLRAPGVAGRWNSSGKMVLYASQSRSLSCLENIVHRSTEGLLRNFFILVIEVADTIHIETLEVERMHAGWHLPYNYQPCQLIGDEWINSNRSCLLKVPSAIIHQEFNFLININHPNFESIRITEKEKFLFDPRLKLQ